MQSNDLLRPRISNILGNSILLRQITPYLPIQSLLALAATSREIRNLIYGNRDAFRYLDLSSVKSAQVSNVPLDLGGVNWRHQRMDEALTQDEFVSGPLRGIFSKFARWGVLEHVQTMILDGLGVTAELVDEIICQDRFNVRILSIRSCGLNERKLMQVLKYAVRPTRAEGKPRLKALYCFGPIHHNFTFADSKPQVAANGLWDQNAPQTGVLLSEGAQIGAELNWNYQSPLRASSIPSDDRWYSALGRALRFKADLGREWAEVMKTCEGVIAFDAVLCRGPRHQHVQRPRVGSEAGNLNSAWLPPAIANVALGAGCVKCESIPEGPAVFPISPVYHLPLLDPPPAHHPSIREAQKPHLLGYNTSLFPQLYVRCEDCLRARFCERCLRWWCEDCYSASEAGKRLAEVSNPAVNDTSLPSDGSTSVKIHMGLCTEHCLVGEMMARAGSNGMWG